MARRRQHVISIEIPRRHLQSVLPQVLSLVEQYGLTLVSNISETSGLVFHIEDAYFGSNMKTSKFGDNSLIVGDGSQIGVMAGTGSTVEHSDVVQTVTRPSTTDAVPSRREWERDVVQILTALADRIDELGDDYDNVKQYLSEGAAVGTADLTEQEALVRKLQMQFSKPASPQVRGKALDFVKSLTGMVAESATKALIEKAIGG
jgi:uncharacterized membrane-anchored protein YhcB (DUF1043 family)